MLNIFLADFFELTPDLVWIMGKDGFVKKANPAVFKKLGYTEDELYNNMITRFIYPDDIEITLLNKFKLFNGELLHNFCNRYVTKSGSIIWLEWTSIFIEHKETVFAIAKDITSRKQIEKDVEEEYNKFKGLATHFKNRIETDRKYFAYELHEELAQLVSVINMDVGWLRTIQTDLPPKANERIEHVSAVSRLLIKTIQRLAFTISPKMLDDVGLYATLEWLCREFTLLNGIPCAFESNYDQLNLSDEMKIDIFRICQEALSNGMNYTEAGSLKIYINEKEAHIELNILDSGKGLNPELEKQAEAFISIQERAVSINGSVFLYNRKGEGSGIVVKMQKKHAPIVV